MKIPSPFRPTRRAALQGIAGLAGTALVGKAAFADDVERKLKPGEFAWAPENAPRGPVSIVVSINQQLMHVHRSGIKIAITTVSTGKPGHETPTGVFTVLQKEKEHYSSTYDNAPMPFMNRLTWSGIALHAGKLPGYPASHGCIRLPLKFAELLYGVTKLGTPVVISGRYAKPKKVTNSGLLLGNYSPDEFDRVSAGQRRKLMSSAEDTGRPVTSVLVSRQDAKIIVLQNGVIVAEGPATIDDPDKPFPSSVFILAGPDSGAKGLRWEALGYEEEDSERDALVPDSSTIERIHGPANVTDAIKDRMNPGMVLVITDQSIGADTRSDTDFVVMTTEE